MATPSPQPTSLLTLLRRNLIAATLIFLVLEIWRPFFFLTDDNLDGGYPFLSEIGHHLLHGQSPFITDHLFGGHYNVLRDPTYFLWHPVYLLVSLLAGTPLHLAMIDVAAYLFFMIATAGYVCLADFLRRDDRAFLSDGWITFYTLSFVYSQIVLVTSASWLNFACSQSALPWLMLGLLQRDARRSLFLITVFTAHEILGGHLAPTISTTLFFSLFAAGLAVQQRSWRPALCWGAGNLIALILVLPVLIPALTGFLTSARAGGVTPSDMLSNNVPAISFPVSIFFGMALWWAHASDPGLMNAHSTYILAFGSSAAAWCVLPALTGRGGWRPLDRLTGALLVIVGLFVCRPAALNTVMTHLPLLKSLRWPFRELLQFQFFLHLFLLLRRPGFTPPWRRRLAWFGVAIYVLPLFTYRLPPTLNSMSWDRRLVLSGKDQVYWGQVRRLLQPDDRVAVLIPTKLYGSDRFDIPYSLLGTYNYACIDGIINVSGYSSTAPRRQLYTTVSYYPFGACIPEYRGALLRDHPGMKFITLEGLQPVKITLSSGTGPAIDLTPFIPHELDPPPHRPPEGGR